MDEEKKGFRLIQSINVNIREPEKVIEGLLKMSKVSFDNAFVKHFLDSGVISAGGNVSASFYNTGRYRTDKEIKELFESSIVFDASQFVSFLFAVLNYQIDPKSSQKYLSNSGRAVCFVVLDKNKEKEYTVTVSFKPFPLLEWRVRVFEENEYRWRTNDWLVVPN